MILKNFKPLWQAPSQTKPPFLPPASLTHPYLANDISSQQRYFVGGSLRSCQKEKLSADESVAETRVLVADGTERIADVNESVADATERVADVTERGADAIGGIAGAMVTLAWVAADVAAASAVVAADTIARADAS